MAVDASAVTSVDPEQVQMTISPVLQMVKHYSPFIITYGLIYTLVSRMTMGSGNPFNSLNSLGSNPGSVSEESTTTFDDVAGCDYAKKELEEVVDFMKNPGKYETYGAKLPRGILFSSQPGMGKTLMAKALAGESGVPLVSVSGSEFVSIFVGNGPKRVKEVYNLARKSSPCFVFIDEIDSVASQRGATMGGGGNDEREATLNQLLTEIDGMNTDTTVITIGATNRPDLLDSALTRPGRMDRKIDIGSLDYRGRRAVLDVHFKNKPLDPEFDLDAFSQQTMGMSGAALANIANEAAIMAAIESAKMIDKSHVERAFDKLVVGIRLEERVIEKETLRTVAFHEAGHALASYLLGSPDRVSRISIVPSSSGAAGFTMFMPGSESDSGLQSKLKLEIEIGTLLGGRASEEVVFGGINVTTGAFDDIRRAKLMCQSMVEDLGMGGDVGFNEFDSKNKAVEILNNSYSETLQLLQRNKYILYMISNILMEEKEISGERFYEIVQKQ